MLFQNHAIFFSVLPLDKLMDNTKWTWEKNYTHFVIKNLSNAIIYSDKSCRKKLFRASDLSCFSIFLFHHSYLLKNSNFHWRTIFLVSYWSSTSDSLTTFICFLWSCICGCYEFHRTEVGIIKSEPNSITLISQSITPFSINNKLFCKDVLRTS